MRIRSGLLASVALIVLTADVRAGLVVELVPEPPPLDGQFYFPDQVVRTEVFLRQDVLGMDHYVRFLRFDFGDSQQFSTLLSLPVTHPDAALHFWVFSDFDCGFGCGAGYAIDDEILPKKSDNVVSINWAFPFPSPTGLTIRLPGNGERLRIGVIDVQMPGPFGDAWFDILNADELDPALGAEFRFGFGFDEPETTWRAEFGQITGGRYLFQIAPEPTTLALLLGALPLIRRHLGHGQPQHGEPCIEDRLPDKYARNVALAATASPR